MKLRGSIYACRGAEAGLLLIELFVIASIFYLLLAFLSGHTSQPPMRMSSIAANAPLYRSLFLLSMCYIVCFLFADSMVFQRLARADQVFIRASKTLSRFIVSSLLLIWGMQLPILALSFLIPFYLLLCLCVSIIRMGVFCLIRTLRSRGFNRQEILLLGNSKSIPELYTAVTVPSTGMKVAGYYSDRQDTNLLRNIQYLGTPSEAATILRKVPAEQEIISILPMMQEYENDPYHQSIGQSSATCLVMPRLFRPGSSRMTPIPLQSIILLASKPEPMAFTHNRVLKRGGDMLGAVILLLTIFPLIFLIIAIVSKVKYHGSVLFRERRTDTRGRKYWHYSFGLSKTLPDDKRHILDGWAEIINVLFGNLSFVGLSRQELADPISAPSPYLPKYGILNWKEALHNSLHDDSPTAWYRHNWSFPLDIYIILHKLTHLRNTPVQHDTQRADLHTPIC